MHAIRSLFVLVVLPSLAAASFVGCGDGGGAGGGGGGVPGTYVLDTDTTLDAMTKDRAPNATPEQLKAAKEMAGGMLAQLDMTLSVKGDKTWDGKFSGMGQTNVAKGTWSQSGNTITFVTTEKDGKPGGDDPKTAVVVGGKLLMEEGPMKIYLKKR